MTTHMLKLALAPIVERRRHVRLLWMLAACWGAVALAAAAMIATGAHPVGPFTLAVIAAVAALVIWKRHVRWEPDYREIARIVETRHPELHALLLTAVEQQPHPKTGELHFLQKRVVQQAIEESRKHSWIDAVPRSRWAAVLALQFVMLFAMAFSLTRLGRSAHEHARALELAKHAVEVTPGDIAIERGSGLVVLAKFGKPVPSEATLVIQPKNEAEQRFALVKNLDDPVFGGGLPEVDAELSYRIEYAGKSTRDFRVSVFEHPRLERADATLAFPEYTRLPEKKIPDTRRISAVEGTKLGVEFQLNKPVKSARLIGKDKSEIPLAVDPQKPVATLRELTLKSGETYELKLEDADGRANKLPAQLVVDVRPNRRPELKFAAPKGDQDVSAIQEVSFKAEAWDDFGMPAYGLSYTVTGNPAQELVLGRDSKPDEKLVMEHVMKLEDLSVQQDQLVSWYLWGDDVGPDGKVRRTASDIFFAEVRPFEEIYRPGQGGESGQQQQQSAAGQTAERMAASQKQIIVATWNLKRAQDAAGFPPATEKYLRDEPVVRDGQADVLKKSKAAEEKIEDAKSKALMENATKAMQTALDRLNEAATTPEPLPAALDAEQAAYNALLKLAAHEFEVTRQQSSSGQQQSQQSRQAQLDQLEMKDEKDRYEAKREAQPQQNEQQREAVALFNRLKELAQRQNDINERMKELQTALQEAKTEKAKEELRRELKRLREEEQQLLADLDEARQKMEQSANASQFAEERKQLEETRGEAQKSAEAMEKGDPSQALASGTRAQRQLQQVRDDFRKKTAGEFNDAMREMRSEARQLAENQAELAERLARPDAAPRRTLDGSSGRELLEKQFGEQQKALGGLRDKMKDVSERAEGPEPLLSKELYDALRKNTQAGTDQMLERAGQLASRGYGQQAQKFEQKARGEIDELKTSVERAAESVLGNEAEALRTARAELDDLARQINREIAQADPSQAEPDARAADGKSGTDGSEGNDGRDASGAREAGTANSQDAQSANPGRAPVPGAGERVPQSRTSQGDRNENRLADSQQGSAGDRPGNPNDAADSREARAPGSVPAPGAGERAPRSRTSEGESNAEQPADSQQESQGDRPGETTGSARGTGARPGASPREQAREGENDRQPGEQSNPQSPGQRAGGQQPGQGQPAGAQQSGQQPGGQRQGQQPGEGQQPGQGQQASAQSGPSQADQPGTPTDRPGSSLRELAKSPRQRGGILIGASNNHGGGDRGGGAEMNEGPLRGDGFVQWSDRMRNVEEMLDQPAVRNEVARVREAAQAIRAEFKRHSVEPKWDVVKSKITAPLAELRDRLGEELARRESKDALVPIDRDPVPPKYSEHVRRYYEELGRSR
jgi:hypothetical protein